MTVDPLEPEHLRVFAQSLGLDLPEHVAPHYVTGLREAFSLAQSILGTEDLARYWFVTTSVSLGARPVVLMHSPSGLDEVLSYLRSMSASRGVKG